MSRKIEKTDKKIPNGSQGFSLNPCVTGCSDFPEQSTTFKQSGQSGPTIKTQIENLLRGIPLKIQVDVLHNLLCLLEQEDASFREKIYGNHLEYRPTDCLHKNCFSTN